MDNLLNNTVGCWGDNTYGQLGINSASTNSATKIIVPIITNAVSVATGLSHSCAVLNGSIGNVKCWGKNDYGQLGNNGEENSYPPAYVTDAFDFPLNGAITVTCGSSHSCALLNDKTVKCWGSNGLGQLGNGDPSDLRDYRSYVPVKYTSGQHLTDVVTLSGGWWHTCALTTDKNVKCWGGNSKSQLGGGTSLSSDYYVEPVNVIDAFGEVVSEPVLKVRRYRI